MPYTPLLGTLGYVLSPDKEKVLLVHRHGRATDIHEGKYSGLGGKLEPDEDIVTGIKREIMEEAGITCESITLRGTINWTGFGPKNEDWFGFIFLIDHFSGVPYEKNIEGTLEWVEREKILDLPMWEGDRFFLPLVFDEDPRPFHGYLPYKDNRPTDWRYTRI